MEKDYIDLIEMVTGFNNTKMRPDGIKYPTVFVYYSGHVDKLTIDVHSKGWHKGCDYPDKSWEFYYSEEPLKAKAYREIREELESII